ncbi:hypothetical protein IWX48DRAFT_593994 [Phyllosticta citricarpa]
MASMVVADPGVADRSLPHPAGACTVLASAWLAGWLAFKDRFAELISIHALPSPNNAQTGGPSTVTRTTVPRKCRHHAFATLCWVGPGPLADLCWEHRVFCFPRRELTDGTGLRDRPMTSARRTRQSTLLAGHSPSQRVHGLSARAKRDMIDGQINECPRAAMRMYEMEMGNQAHSHPAVNYSPWHGAPEVVAWGAGKGSLTGACSSTAGDGKEVSFEAAEFALTSGLQASPQCLPARLD